MKHLILGSLSVLLMSAVTAPAVRSEVKILGTPSNPAADPGSRLAPGMPGVPTTSEPTMPQEIPPANMKMLQETLFADSNNKTIIGPLGTPSNPAVNPAEDPGSRIAPGTPGAPTTSDDMMPQGR